MFKIIDYEGETLTNGFPSCEAAYRYLYISFSVDFIHEMQFKVIREEEEDEHSDI